MPEISPRSPAPVRTDRYEAAFTRLASMQGGDPGFFILAVHSFMEGALRASVAVEDCYEDSFQAFMDAFRDGLIARGGGRFVQGLGVLSDIKNQHRLTNSVRHRFQAAEIEEARAATQHLRRFCALAGIPESDGLRRVVEYLKAWEDRRPNGQLLRELNELGYRFQMESRSGREKSDRIAALETAETEVTHLREEIAARDRKLRELGEAKDRKDAKVDELRAERNELASRLKAASEKAAAYDDAREYVEMLRRITVLTRTRADYERTIIKLSDEQKKVLEQITLDKDFLVKGAAGTGKTLVLLKAIEKARGEGAQAELGMDEIRGSVALLTYTTTLVKYDRFLSGLMLGEGLGDTSRIGTVDGFLAEQLRAIEPGATVEFGGKFLAELAALHPCEGFETKDLATEAEQYLWANDISKKDYVTDALERRGMKKPIPRELRAPLWAAAEAMAAEMGSRAVFSRNYAALKLVRAAEAGVTLPGAVDYVFIDEAQDLPAVALKALKACARRCVVLAGDADQSIYQPGFSYRRAGLDIGGRSRILRTNFRNTVEIHETAERYRVSVQGFDAENQPQAFRNGPAPELFKGANRAELADLMVQRVSLLVGKLGYDPENLCIMAPLNDDIAFMQERMDAAGFKTLDIRDPDFSFDTPGAVRITTLHSAKGLDFPVVLLLLYRPPYFGDSFDEASVERMTGNLVYVALTRAMDHLNVFTLEEPKSAAIRALVGAVERCT